MFAEKCLLFFVEAIWSASLFIGRLCYNINNWLIPKPWAEAQSLPTLTGIRFIGPLYQFAKLNWNVKGVAPIAYTYQCFEGLTVLFRKEKYLVFDACSKKFALLFDADAIQKVLKKSSPKKADLYNLIITGKGPRGLIICDVESWKEQRKTLRPCLKQTAVNRYQDSAYENSQKIVDEIKKVGGEVKNLAQFFAMFSFDVICEFAFGCNGRSIEGQQYQELVEAFKTMPDITVQRMLQPLLWHKFIFKRSKLGKQAVMFQKRMIDFSKELLANRRNEFLVERKAFTEEEAFSEKKSEASLLDALLLKQMKSHYTDNDIINEIITFLFAGSDTTSFSITTCLLLLGLHPEIQERLAQELLFVLGENCEREITTEDIKQMKYLNCVIKETRRLYTPVPLIGRHLEEDLPIDGKAIPKGTDCIIFLGGLHKHPQYFKNPEVFDPERFSEENAAHFNPSAYIPFSDGPRNCIGYMLAELQEAMTIANVIRNFKIVSFVHRDEIPIVPSITSQLGKAAPVQFTPRIFT